MVHIRKYNFVSWEICDRTSGIFCPIYSQNRPTIKGQNVLVDLWFLNIQIGYINSNGIFDVSYLSPDSHSWSVYIEACGKLGSGVLISVNQVLTASHIFQKPNCHMGVEL